MAGKENTPQDQAGQEMRGGRGGRQGTSSIDNKPRKQTAFSVDRVEEDGSAIVSVTELIPGINVEGLVLKGSPDHKRHLNFEYNPEVFTYEDISSKLNTPYASYLYHFTHLSPEDKISAGQALNEALKDQTVIDLGAGGYAQGYYVIGRAGAKGYVAVEPYFAYATANTIAEIKRSGNDKGFSHFAVKHQIKSIPAAVVAEEMLGFLKRVPDNSASVFCSGIDRAVTNDDEYIALVADEIMRVMAKNGAYIGNGGKHIPLPRSKGIHKEFIGERDSWGDSESGSFYIYKKV